MRSHYTYCNSCRIMNVYDTFRIFSARMNCRVNDKASLIDTTTCTARVQSFSLAVDFDQTRSSNLMVKQSKRVNQKTLALTTLAGTSDLERSKYISTKYFCSFMHGNYFQSLRNVIKYKLRLHIREFSCLSSLKSKTTI